MSKTEFSWEITLPESNIFWLIVGTILGILIAMLTMLGFANAQQDNIDTFIYDLYINWYKSPNNHTAEDWRHYSEAVLKLHKLCSEEQFSQNHESCDVVEEMYDALIDAKEDDAVRSKNVIDKFLQDIIPRLTELKTDHA